MELRNLGFIRTVSPDWKNLPKCPDLGLILKRKENFLRIDWWIRGRRFPLQSLEYQVFLDRQRVIGAAWRWHHYFCLLLFLLQPVTISCCGNHFHKAQAAAGEFLEKATPNPGSIDLSGKKFPRRLVDCLKILPPSETFAKSFFSCCASFMIWKLFWILQYLDQLQI